MMWSAAIFVLVYAALFAMLEIEIEGPHGWAERLPTVPVVGKFTGYHCVMNVMVVFTLLYALLPALGAWATLFFVVGWFLIEDFVWFVLNPSFGICNYTRDKVKWHGPYWPFGIPLHNFIGLAVMLFAAIMAGNALQLLLAGAIMAAGVVAIVFAAPSYMKLYASVRAGKNKV